MVKEGLTRSFIMVLDGSPSALLRLLLALIPDDGELALRMGSTELP